MQRVFTHDDLARTSEAEGSSDRRFGLTCAAALVAFALWPLAHHAPIRRWPLAVAAMVLAVSLVRPAVLAPANRLWLRLGLLLQRIVSPVVLATVFSGVVTTTGFLARSLGKNPLRLHFDRGARTYWIERRPPGPAPDTMPRQF